MKFKLITPETGADLQYTNERIVDFLYNHLEEYGDPKEDIMNCLNYALSSAEAMGGFILLGLSDGDDIIGTVVFNKTGMKGYIPENILVYIATHADYRGQGVGKQLMEYCLKVSDGDVALHVEADNPAKFLYEKVGFTNPYLEMRYKRK